MQKVLGFAMGVMAIAMPESAVIAVPLACAFLFTRNILSIRPVVVDADGGVIAVYIHLVIAVLHQWRSCPQE